VQRSHVEAVGGELATEGNIELHSQFNGSRRLVRVGKDWFSFRKLVKRSALLAGLPEIFETNLTQPEDGKWRDHLRMLGFNNYFRFCTRLHPRRRSEARIFAEGVYDATH
jgi:hypothetical protein